MFRAMRRIKRQMPEEESVAVLKRATSGVLAVNGDDGYPYTVPMSFVYDDGKLYFHGAPAGHRIDSVRKSGKASFCIIEKDDVVPEEFATNFRSVVCMGEISIVTDDNEKRSSITKLADKYSPGLAEERDREIAAEWKALTMFRLDVQHMTGKERK